MKSAATTTVLMGILALVAVSAAASVYPWPKLVTENAQVNKPLFQDYDTSSVRGIEIVAYNEDTTRIDRLRVKRKGERWVIPQKSEFDVTGGDRVIQITKALIGRVVVDVNSDSQTDHVKFGVVDPTQADARSTRSSLGTRFELTNRNQKQIGSLIVGRAVKDNPQNRYVRIPGKPTVYTIEFPDGILSTDFSKWTSPNLLGLPTRRGRPGASSTPRKSIVGITVKKYRVADVIQGQKEKEDIYDLQFAIEGRSQMRLARGTVAGKEIEANKIPPNFLPTVVQSMLRLQIADVANQTQPIIAALRSNENVDDNELIKSLQKSGFGYRGWENNGHQFDTANGVLTVELSDGVRQHVLIGGLSTAGGGNASLKLLYHVMLTADLDTSVFPEPEQPENIDQDESIKKAYLRNVKERQSQIDLALQQVAEFNRNHSRWIYVMDETVIQGLFPEIDAAE